MDAYRGLNAVAFVFPPRSQSSGLAGEETQGEAPKGGAAKVRGSELVGRCGAPPFSNPRSALLCPTGLPDPEHTVLSARNQRVLANIRTKCRPRPNCDTRSLVWNRYSRIIAYGACEAKTRLKNRDEITLVRLGDENAPKKVSKKSCQSNCGSFFCGFTLCHERYR